MNCRVVTQVELQVGGEALVFRKQAKGDLLHRAFTQELVQRISAQVQVLVASLPGSYHCPKQGLELRFFDDHGLALPMVQL
ncbi:hypothetical protein D3C77_380890 [compost metagenome]